MDKPYLNYNEQIEKLKSKGLTISDEKYALTVLKKYGYYSLICGYKDAFKNKTTKNYKDGTKFEEIVQLYEFDAALRRLFLQYSIIVEKQLKVHLATAFTENFSESQCDYLDVNNYDYDTLKNRQDINTLIKVITSIIDKGNYHYIEHAKANHNNVPLWVLLNAVTFGQTVKMYQLQKQSIKYCISKEYPFLNEGTLAPVLREVTICRNSCAHGERLYTFKTREACPKLMLHEKLNIPLNANGNEYTYGQRDLFSVVISFKYLLDSSDFKEFKNSLSKLIKRYQRESKAEIVTMILKEMGFPSNWETITKYRKY